jgi:hypothetical protein
MFDVPRTGRQRGKGHCSGIAGNVDIHEGCQVPIALPHRDGPAVRFHQTPPLRRASILGRLPQASLRPSAGAKLKAASPRLRAHQGERGSAGSPLARCKAAKTVFQGPYVRFQFFHGEAPVAATLEPGDARRKAPRRSESLGGQLPQYPDAGNALGLPDD